MSPTRELLITDTLIEGPSLEPLDLELVRLHLKITSTREDPLIDTYLSGARHFFEEATGRQLLDATWERRLEGFPDAWTDRPFPNGVIELPHPPLLDVVSVTVLSDESPAETVLVEGTDYVVEAPAGPYASRGFVRPVSAWPSASGIGSVVIRYRAGYGTVPAAMPEPVKLALLMLTGHFYQFRSAVFAGDPGTSLEALPLGIYELIRPFAYAALPSQPASRTTWPV